MSITSMQQMCFSDIDDVPVSSALVTLNDALQHILSVYDELDLKETGIDVEEELQRKMMSEVMGDIELKGVEPRISEHEAFSSLYAEEMGELFSIEVARSEYFDLRQLEEQPNGVVVDISAYNTVDYLRDHAFEFNKNAYWAEKVKERVKDIALLHSVVDAERKGAERQKCVDYIMLNYGNYQRYIIEQLKSGGLSAEDGFDLRSKLLEVQGRIRGLRKVWKDYAC